MINIRICIKVEYNKNVRCNLSVINVRIVIECIMNNLIGRKNEIIKILDTKEVKERKNEYRFDKQKTD